MALEESIDKLTASIDKLIAQGGVAGAAAGKTAAPKTAAAKTAKPKYTAEQVKAKFQELRGNDSIGAPPLKELIAELGHADLAALLAAPASFDDAYAKLEELEASVAGGGGDDDL